MDAGTVGEAGGRHVTAAVIRESSDDFVVVLSQGGTAGGEPPRYEGQITPLELQADGDWGGSFRFAGLAIATTSTNAGEPDPGPFVGVDWPSSLSGRVEWTCDEVPN